MIGLPILILLLVAQPLLATTSSQPNILLIIADDQGMDASAQYSVSGDLPRTPTLDALAATGIVYDNVWATPGCTTTRATMFTGQFGVNSGIDYIPAKLTPQHEILQTFLRRQPQSSNYRSAVIGKWHMGGHNPAANHPETVGIEHFAGNLKASVDDYFTWSQTVNGRSTSNSTYHTTAITDFAIDWVKNQDGPWFLWLAYAAPHAPFHAPPSALHKRSLAGSNADLRKNPRAYYLAAIEAMDTEIGRLLDSIPEKFRDNTLIIYIGDNGTPARVADQSVYDLDKVKGSLYEGGIRVPLVVSGKGIHRHGEIETSLVNSVDIFATVVELAGGTEKRIHDSVSFVPTFSGANAGLREHNYAEFKDRRINGWAVRDARYKFIQLDGEVPMLFDLQLDRREARNLAGQAEFDQKIAELVKVAASIRGEQTSEATGSFPGSSLHLAAEFCCAAFSGIREHPATDRGTGKQYQSRVSIVSDSTHCSVSANSIPDHDFNDGSRSFRNPVSEQNQALRIPLNPQPIADPVALSLRTDNGVLLNGVKIDLLAAGCFGVGDGKIGCNDMDTPWRYDPMHGAGGFDVDSYHAHTQPNGAYHYHAVPNQFQSRPTSGDSPVIGFAADGYPIFGGYIEENGVVRVVKPSYRLKSGIRPGGPGGKYDGTFRDDYEYIAQLGDLDECNGMLRKGSYGYYATAGFPYVMACFKGNPDPSFNKQRPRGARP